MRYKTISLLKLAWTKFNSFIDKWYETEEISLTIIWIVVSVLLAIGAFMAVNIIIIGLLKFVL